MNTILAAERYETGRKVFFWYRVYCLVMAFAALVVSGFGFFIALVPTDAPRRDAEQMFYMGIAYAAIGLIAFLVFAVAALLPAKPYNWIVGMIVIALGMATCCTWPAAIPLITFWVRSETQEFLGRKTSP